MKKFLIFLLVVCVFRNMPETPVGEKGEMVVVDGHSYNVVYRGNLAECVAWISENSSPIGRMIGGDGGLEYVGRFRIESPEKR